MRRAWLILLLVALLPVRGWAAAGMALAAPLSGMPTPVAFAAMPCHAEAADDAAAGQDDDEVQASHLCASCDLCHGAIAAAATGPMPPGPAPGEGPLVAPSRDTGRLLAASLERPPRA